MDHARRPGLRDAWLPAALFVFGAVELGTLRTDGWLASIGLELVAAVVLVLRRSHPAVVAPLVTGALMVIPMTGARMDDAAAPIFFIVLAIFCVGRYLALRGGLLVLAITGAMAVADSGFDPADNDWTDVVFVLALAIPPYFFGRISRKLADQAELLAQQQEKIRDQAVRDERDRIARELHDVIAHSVSAMVVQTAAAQDLLRTRPERAAELLDAVAQTGRDALAETGRLLHLIRDDSDELGLRPAPGLRDVPALVAGFRDGGLPVDARLELPSSPVAAGVDVSVYRVIQEALTNAVKHGTGTVELTVSSDPSALRIECSNAVAERPGHGSGLGLQGMAERVSVVGGRLEQGVNGDGRFHLDVTLPLHDGKGAR